MFEPANCFIAAANKKRCPFMTKWWCGWRYRGACSRARSRARGKPAATSEASPPSFQAHGASAVRTNFPSSSANARMGLRSSEVLRFPQTEHVLVDSSATYPPHPLLGHVAPFIEVSKACASQRSHAQSKNRAFLSRARRRERGR